jgi:hypothetical protein
MLLPSAHHGCRLQASPCCARGRDPMLATARRAPSPSPFSARPLLSTHPSHGRRARPLLLPMRALLRLGPSMELACDTRRPVYSARPRLLLAYAPTRRSRSCLGLCCSSPSNRLLLCPPMATALNSSLLSVMHTWWTRWGRCVCLCPSPPGRNLALLLALLLTESFPSPHSLPACHHVIRRRALLPIAEFPTVSPRTSPRPSLPVRLRLVVVLCCRWVPMSICWSSIWSSELIWSRPTLSMSLSFAFTLCATASSFPFMCSSSISASPSPLVAAPCRRLAILALALTLCQMPLQYLPEEDLQHLITEEKKTPRWHLPSARRKIWSRICRRVRGSGTTWYW